MRKLYALLFSFTLLYGLCSAVDIEQSFSDSGVTHVKVSLDKRTDSEYFVLDDICKNLSSTKFYEMFTGVSCDDGGQEIIIEGNKDLSTDLTVGRAFSSHFDFFDSVYEFNYSEGFEGMATEESILWGAVPLNVSYKKLVSYGENIDYTVKMPGSISMVRNGDISKEDSSIAEFKLAESVYRNRILYVSARKTSWKFFSSIMIFGVMVLGISMVWLLFFYLKSKA